MKLLNSKEICRILAEPLAKRVDQQLVEKWSQSFWSLNQNSRHNGHNNKKPFVMMLPPPNITGNLHLGHALTCAIEDAIIRHRRMSGWDARWIPGFDHAGLATQSIVEKVLLDQQGITRADMGRERFMKFSSDWKELKTNEMRQQLKRLGLDLDYSKEFFTTDEKSSKAVQIAFKRLFAKGLIYRDQKIVHWSNQLQTTLSDIEVTEVDGVKRYVRTNEEVVPRSLSQWFINCNEIAKRAVEVVQDASITMIPQNYKNSWSAWLLENGVQDWCISRQSWWGHKIPAFKSVTSQDNQQSWVMSDTEQDAKELLKCSDVMQDPDVLDTWFSSSLIPLTISGWPDERLFNESCLNETFPLQIMETGFDILTFWVTKMVMMSIALEDKIPFNLILLHGMICDSEGKKMSKSKGNVIDPNDLINGTHNLPACGADGLRAYLLSQDFQNEVIRLQIAQVDKFRRVMNKVWNIFRFSISILESSDKKIIPELTSVENLELGDLDESDKNLLDELSKCIATADKSFNETYKLHHLTTSIELFWNSTLSAQYLPKLKVYSEDEKLKKKFEIKLKVLVHCLITTAKLFHPVMPHLTEFLYQKLSMVLDRQEVNDDKLQSLQSIYESHYPKTRQS